MKKLSIGDILVRIAEREGASTDQKLGEVLGKARSTVSNWRQRGAIPIEELAEYCLTNKISFDWLLTGEEPKSTGIPLDAAKELLLAFDGKATPTPDKITMLLKMVEDKWPMSKRDIDLLVELVI